MIKKMTEKRRLELQAEKHLIQILYKAFEHLFFKYARFKDD